MAKQIQRRRGTTAEHATFTGAVGEITVDTDKKVAVVHDNSTAGGLPMARPGLAQTFTAKQTFENFIKLQRALEKVTITADNPASGDNNFDYLTQSIQFYTVANDTNFTINVRGDGSTTLNSLMAIGEAAVIVVEVTNTGTPYYMNGPLKIDGTADDVTVKWANAAPAAGNANAQDSYTFAIFKTADATFFVRASLTKYVT